jgi:hypothetical protein
MPSASAKALASMESSGAPDGIDDEHEGPRVQRDVRFLAGDDDVVRVRARLERQRADGRPGGRVDHLHRVHRRGVHDPVQAAPVPRHGDRPDASRSTDEDQGADSATLARSPEAKSDVVTSRWSAAEAAPPAWTARSRPSVARQTRGLEVGGTRDMA